MISSRRTTACRWTLRSSPADDTKVYATLQQADTVGMFQVESRAQMASLPRNNPTRFYDLVVQVAIIRPGPIVGNMTNPYMLRRQGKQEIKYYHPLLEPVLKRTLGVPLFQEQLLRMAMIVANFSGSEAEELRRALGMRRSTQRMRELGVKLRHGMTENGIDPQTQEEIVQSISSFALYGFPESHAASFALIAYASAFFKEYYLAAFTCAMLNNQPMGFYSPAVLVKDAQRHGLRVLPIDVQKSSWDCTVEELSDQTKALRLGLRYVRGMRQSSAEVLVRSREEHGAFESSDDLGRRVPALNRKEMVALASIGALNWVGETGHRRDALWQVERVSRRPGPLLQSAEEAEDVSPLERMSWEERLVADFQGTGLTVGKHPMAYHRSRLARLNISSCGRIEVCRERTLRMHRRVRNCPPEARNGEGFYLSQY